MEDVLCNEDTKYCYKVNARFTKKTNALDFRANFSFGCMPTVDRETSHGCSEIKEEITLIESLQSNAGMMTMTYLDCKQCSSDYCNRPVLLQSINMVKKTQNSYITLIPDIIKVISLIVRLFTFDLNVITEIIALF